jgi:hypothetical protein
VATKCVRKNTFPLACTLQNTGFKGKGSCHKLQSQRKSREEQCQELPSRVLRNCFGSRLTECSWRNDEWLPYFKADPCGYAWEQRSLKTFRACMYSFQEMKPGLFNQRQYSSTTKSSSLAEYF